MLSNIIRKIGRWLRSLEDPRYRTQPLVLPRAWHGSGTGGLTAEQLSRFNARDMGHDPAVVFQQPINQMLRTMSEHDRKGSMAAKPKRQH